MSQLMQEEIKRRTARRKSALGLEIIQGKTTAAEASRQFDLTPSEIESWVDDAKRGMENGCGPSRRTCASSTSASSRNCRKRTVRRCWSCAPEKIGVPVGQGRDLMVTIQQGLREDGFEVSMVKLCRWFGMARRTVYYRPTKAP